MHMFDCQQYMDEDNKFHDPLKLVNRGKFTDAGLWTWQSPLYNTVPMLNQLKYPAVYM